MNMHIGEADNATLIVGGEDVGSCLRSGTLVKVTAQQHSLVELHLDRAARNGDSVDIRLAMNHGETTPIFPKRLGYQFDHGFEMNYLGL